MVNFNWEKNIHVSDADINNMYNRNICISRNYMTICMKLRESGNVLEVQNWKNMLTGPGLLPIFLIGALLLNYMVKYIKNERIRINCESIYSGVRRRCSCYNFHF